MMRWGAVEVIAQSCQLNPAVLRRGSDYFHGYSFPVAVGLIIAEAAVASIRCP